MGGINEPERLVRIGFDYTSVESVMRMLGIEDMTDTFYRLLRLEHEALETFAEYARAEAARAFHRR